MVFLLVLSTSNLLLQSTDIQLVKVLFQKLLVSGHLPKNDVILFTRKRFWVRVSVNGKGVFTQTSIRTSVLDPTFPYPRLQ